ncbi:MAG: lysoplasmalogenase, partial [Mycobacterium sp.]
MGSLDAESAMGSPYAGAPRAVRMWWTAGVLAAVGYGVFLAVTAVRGPAGTELTGQFGAQPAVKAATAVFLALAAWFHPIVRERRWLVAALLLSAAGDFFLAMPWWKPAFVCGLGSFLVAHVCFLGALLPLRGDYRRPRLVLVGLLGVTFVGMLIRFWPAMGIEGLTVPVTVYMLVLAAMVSAALLARLPTIWTALGGLLFAVSDGMIGVGKFVLGSQALELPIWWVYSASIVLI